MYQCLNNGFQFLEFESNWLNNYETLIMEQNSVVLSNVVSASVKNVSYFSSNWDNGLVSRASVASSKANSNSKSNSVLQDHSKSHILPVSLSASNFYVSSTLFKSSDAIVPKKNLVLKFSGRCSVKKVFLKVSNSQEKTCARVYTSDGYFCLFVTQNSQSLKVPATPKSLSQFLQQIARTFLIGFLQSLKLDSHLAKTFVLFASMKTL